MHPQRRLARAQALAEGGGGRGVVPEQRASWPGRQRVRIELQPAELEPGAPKVEAEPELLVEAEAAGPDAVQTYVPAKVAQGVQGHLVSDAARAVPAADCGDRGRIHPDPEIPTWRAQVLRKRRPAPHRATLANVAQNAVIAALEEPA